MTSKAPETDHPPVVLIAGHWLGAWAWEQVTEQLTSRGLRAIAMTLPGLDPQDPKRRTRTLEEQIAAIQAVMDAEQGAVVLVAHSGANAPVSAVIDRNPQQIKRVVWVDSGPVAPGTVFAADLPETIEEAPLPSFDVLGEQASLEGLTSEHLERFRARAVPEPGPVLRAAAYLTNEDRLAVPTTLVCCSMPGAQILELAKAGHPMFAEVAKLSRVHIVDLPTGHWPMWSRPTALAEAIVTAALRPA